MFEDGTGMGCKMRSIIRWAGWNGIRIVDIIHGPGRFKYREFFLHVGTERLRQWVRNKSFIA